MKSFKVILSIWENSLFMALAVWVWMVVGGGGGGGGRGGTVNKNTYQRPMVNL